MTAIPSAFRDNYALPVTTAQLQRDLDEILQVIAILRAEPRAKSDEFDDMTWLQVRRRYVLAVLAGRKAMRDRKIVNIDEWRAGGVNLPSIAANAA